MCQEDGRRCRGVPENGESCKRREPRDDGTTSFLPRKGTSNAVGESLGEGPATSWLSRKSTISRSGTVISVWFVEDPKLVVNDVFRLLPLKEASFDVSFMHEGSCGFGYPYGVLRTDMSL